MWLLLPCHRGKSAILRFLPLAATQATNTESYSRLQPSVVTHIHSEHCLRSYVCLYEQWESDLEGVWGAPPSGSGTQGGGDARTGHWKPEQRRLCFNSSGHREPNLPSLKSDAGFHVTRGTDRDSSVGLMCFIFDRLRKFIKKHSNSNQENVVKTA